MRFDQIHRAFGRRRYRASVGSAGDSYDNSLAETTTPSTRPITSATVGVVELRCRQVAILNGPTGSTNTERWSLSATSRRPRLRNPTTPRATSTSWRRFSNQTAFDKPGAVQFGNLAGTSVGPIKSTRRIAAGPTALYLHQICRRQCRTRGHAGVTQLRHAGYKVWSMLLHVGRRPSFPWLVKLEPAALPFPNNHLRAMANYSTSSRN